MKQIVKRFLVYDQRACGGVGADDALCLVICDTYAEAKTYREDFPNAALYCYEVKSANAIQRLLRCMVDRVPLVRRVHGLCDKLINEKWLEDWWEK